MKYDIAREDKAMKYDIAREDKAMKYDIARRTNHEYDVVVVGGRSRGSVSSLCISR